MKKSRRRARTYSWTNNNDNDVTVNGWAEREYLQSSVSTRPGIMPGGKQVFAVAPEPGAEPDGLDALELEILDSSHLHQALKDGNSLDDVRRLLADEGRRVDSKDGQNGFTALHLAAKLNRADVVGLLLDRGASIDAKSSDGCSPLHIGSRFNAIDAMEVLLQRAADPNVCSTANSFTPLHEAAAFGHLAAAQCLLGTKKTHVDVGDTQGVTPLHLACCHGYRDVCTVLLDHGASVEVRTTNGSTALHYAASNADSTIAELLLKSALSPGMDSLTATFTMNRQQRKAFLQFINTTDGDLSTPLHRAVQVSNLMGAELLLQHGAQINSKTMSNQRTALHLAALAGNSEMLRLLISKGAEIDAQDGHRRTPLHVAASWGHCSAIGVLIENGASVHATDNDGKTPLLVATSTGRVDCVEFLYNAGATLAACDTLLRSCLHLAVLEEKVELLEFLLRKAEAELVNCPDMEGRTPLHYAALSQNEQILGLLLEKKAVCGVRDLSHKTPLHLAAERGQTVHVRLLGMASPASLLEHDDAKRTPLHAAAMNKRKKTCTVLIRLGADLVGRDALGHPPLLLAASCGATEVVRLLLDKDVPRDSVNTNGNTALHLAARAGHVTVVQLLLDHGAAILVNDRGCNCLAVAMEQNKCDVVMAIIKHDRWQEVLLAHGSKHENPLRNLILRFPRVAEVVFDRCVQRSASPTELCVTYDFRMLDPGPDGHLGQDGKRFSGLETMVEGKQKDLLTHPLSRQLLKAKWRTYGWHVFWLNFLVYVAFIALLTTYILFERTTVVLDRPSRSQSSDDDDDANENAAEKIIPFCIFIFAAVNILKELYQMFSQRLKYFTSPINLLEWALYVTAIVFILPQIPEFQANVLRAQPYIYWQIGTITVFLGYVNLMLFSRTLSIVGLYVTMFMEVGKTMGKAMCVFSMFFLAFSVIFFILFKEQDAFHSIEKSIVKVTVMLIGELDYSTMLIDNLEGNNTVTGASLVPYTETSFAVFFIFLWAMPIVLMNLLIGLAVGDIDAIQKNAFLRTKARKINFLVEIESKLPLFLTRRLYKPTLVVRTMRFRRATLLQSSFFERALDILDDDPEFEPMQQEVSDHHQELKRDLNKLKGRMKDVVAALGEIQKTLAAVIPPADERSSDEKLYL